MLRLRLFGGLVLENPDDVPLGRAGQRRRLALLAILASPAGMPVARDKLLGLLWPEVPLDDARHRLSAALYDLRTALGADALAVTTESATLVPGALSIDVVDFENAVASGDFAIAVAGYGGPFLDGVYVAEAPAFERWMDLRRASLQRTFESALEQLALHLGQTGRASEAIEAWRRLQELGPYSGRTTIGLMRALDAAGDRPGAVVQARAHAELLRRELDADPDPAVERFALELKQRPAASAFFDAAPNGNSAEPTARVEDTTLAAPPTSGFDVHPRRRRLNALTAVVAVVLLSMGALSAMRLTRGAAAETPYNTRVTESREAERAFRAAGEHMRAGRFDAAVDGYSRAVSEDSTFALAHYKLAVATLWADRPGSFLDKHIVDARRFTDRLDEVDGVLLSAFIEWRAGNANTAEALYRRVLALDSTSVEAWHQLGETFFHYNPIRGQPIERARAPFERAVHLEPRHFGSLWHLVQLAALEQRAAEVTALTDRLLALRPDAARKLEVEVFRAAALDDESAFDRAFQRLRAVDHSFLFGVAWRLAVFARAPEKAVRVYELMTQADRPAQVRALGHTHLIYLDVAKGRPTQAIARMRELESQTAGLADQLTALAWVELALDDTVRAQSVFTEIDRSTTPRWFGDAGADYSIVHGRERFVRAQALVALGRTAEADQWLAGLETHVPGDLALQVPALLMRARIATLRGDTTLARGFCARADTVWASAESALRSHLRTAPGCSF